MENKLKRATPRFRTKCGTVSRTKQEFTRECNINNLVSKYLKTGQFDNRKGLGIFQDVSNVPNLQQALDIQKSAQISFDNLDPYLRKKFNNNPMELITFLQNPNNKEEAQKLGLLKPPPPVETPKPPPVTPPSDEKLTTNKK